MTSILLWSLGISLTILVVGTDGQGCYRGSGTPAGGGAACGANCTNIKPKVNRTLRQAYLDGELFVNFVPYSDVNLQVDNICYTLFESVGNPNVYVFYDSRVFKNGTIEIQSLLTTQHITGIVDIASPECGTFNDTVFGQVCDTLISYRCYGCNGCPYRFQNGHDVVYGLSRSNQPLSASCFEQSLRVIQANGVPPQRYIPLPMKLPSACVTRQDCVNYQTPGSG